MGWSGGSELGDSFWRRIREHIPEESRQLVARELINALEDQDCDTVYECELLVSDAGLEEEYWPEGDK